MWTFTWTCSGLYTFDDTNFLNYFIIIVYTFLETLHTDCITTLLNGNYIIHFFSKNNFVLLGLIVHCIVLT